MQPATSLCPECLGPAPGTYVERDDAVVLERTCPDHGDHEAVVWASAEHFEWAAEFGPPQAPEGDLNVINSHACLAVIDVTTRCNLACSFCFASSSPRGADRSQEEIVQLLDVVARDGGPRPIQFSGGEPTVHPELLDMVQAARERGFEHIEVNTNGIRLADEPGFAQALAEAGVTATYLQFDGLSRQTHQEIRGPDLSEVKQGAMEACSEAGLPVILVCTVVPGTNDHELGDVVRFALDNREVVRSINFQPVAHFGRYTDGTEPLSVDAVARLLEDQVGFLQERDFLPVPCCSAYCQAATALLPDGSGGALPLTRYIDQELWDQLSGAVDEADWMELLAGTTRAEERSAFVATCCGLELPGSAAGLIQEVLPVGITGFMDADSADLDRLKNCCIAVPTEEDGMVPFCAYNMTTRDGRYALRQRHGWGGRQRVS